MNDRMDNLPAALAELAQEVSIVDIHDEVLRRSRRLGRVRVAVATVVAVLVVLLAGTGLGYARWNRADTPPPLPPATRPPTASAGPSATGPTLRGTVYYLGSVGPTDTVYAWRPGALPTAVLTGKDLGQTVVLSPDGRKLAWLAPVPGSNGVQGRLHVANADGSGDHPVSATNWAAMCTPTWSPDSTRLIVEDVSSNDIGHPFIVTVSTGAARAIPSAPATPVSAWSPDGQTIGLFSGTDPTGDRLMTIRPDGTHRHTIPHTSLAGPIMSLSPDGTRVATFVRSPTDPEGDIGRRFRMNTILMVATGQPVPLPSLPGPIFSAHYLANGDLLVEVDTAPATLLLLTPDGKIIGQAIEPAGTPGLLLGFRP